jgi:hypothetical protein
MAGRVIQKLGQAADKSLKHPILLEYFSGKSGYFLKDVIRS